jgi:hypothetical protein
VWRDSVRSGPGIFTVIFGRTFQDNGEPTTDIFGLDRDSNGGRGTFAVAVAESGDLLLLRPTYNSLQRFSPDGDELSQVMPSSSDMDISLIRGSPALALSPDGALLAAWTEDRLGGTEPRLVARAFDELDQPLGPDFRVTDSDEAEPEVGLAYLGSDEFVIVWQEDYDEPVIYARRYSLSAGFLGDRIAVSNFVSVVGPPAVSPAASGGFIVLWRGSDPNRRLGIFANRFDSSGNAVPLP